MILAKVLEPVVCTIKDSNFDGKKIFVVQPVDENLKAKGVSFLAFDSMQAGPGDFVLVCREGNGCRQMWGQDQAPVNAVISAIVDSVTAS